MATDVADWTQAVNITGGSVTITGTASVSIVGVPTVAISGTPTVNVGNTPSVTITSGSVTATISGTPSINIQSQAVTIAVNSPPTKLADLTFNSGGTTTQTTAAVPAGSHALELIVKANGLSAVRVVGHTTGAQYYPPQVTSWLGSSPANLALGAVAVCNIDSAQDSQYDITATVGPVVNAVVGVSAFLDTASVWVQNSPSAPLSVLQSQAPWSGADQAPLGFAFGAGANQVVIAAVAGKTIRLFGFEITIEVAAAAGTRVTGGGLTICASLPLSHSIALAGAPLGVGAAFTLTVPAACICSGSVSFSQD